MKIFKNLFLFILIAFILSCSMESELDTTDFSVSLNLQHLVQNKNNLQGRSATTEKSSLILTLYNSQTFPKEQAIEEVLKNRLPVVSSVKVAVSSSEPTKVSFLKIPVGINAIIVAECTINNGEIKNCYTGTSDIFEVQRGRNSVEINLERIATAGSVQFNPESRYVDYGTNVTLSCDTIGAQILYKLDYEDQWTEVDASSVTIPIEKDVTISAIAKVGDMESDAEAKYIVRYKVQFEENGGELNLSEDITVTSENSRSLRNITPIKTGYDFKGWYSDSNFDDETKKDTVSSGDATEGVIKLYAKWEAITYTVEFNANGGVAPSAPSQTFTYDVPQNLKENVFTRDGYAFNGWNIKADGSGDSYTDEQEVKNLSSTQGTVVTLYAQWKKIESKIEIEFNEYSDVPFNKDYVTKNGSTITITIPNGYSVVAWEKDGEKINDSEGQNNITVSEWDGGIYTVTIIFKDGAGKFYSYEMQVTINKSKQ